MALKSKVTKAEFDALPEALKEHYKEVGDHYLLDSDDAEELRKAKEREAEERKREKERADAAEKAQREAEERERVAKEEAAKKKGDIAALELSWKEKSEKAVADEKTKREATEAQLRMLLVDNVAISIANEISTSPKLIIPHLKARMAAELTGDKPITRVLDADGKPSALSLDDLKKEFVANADFAAIIKGSNANGGGAGGNGSGGGAPSGKKIKDMTEAERTAMARSNPEGYRAMCKAEGILLPA